MQRLRSAENRGERLHGRPYDINVRLLRGQRRAGGLGVKPERHRSGIAGVKTFAHKPCP